METTEKGVNVNEAVASGHKAFQVCVKFGAMLADFQREYQAIQKNVVELVNMREHLRSEIHKAELRLGQVNEEAKARLGNIEKSHQALVERLTKKELELIAQKKETEILRASAEKERRELDLIKAEYERRMEGLKEMAAAKVAARK